MTYWKSSEFKALQEAWYQRLASEGFQDAEVLVNGELELKWGPHQAYQRMKPINREMREAYYRILSQKVADAKFRNEVDRLILSRFAEGKKIKLIVEELRSRGSSRCRNSITFIIRRYEMLWGLREYTLKQLNRRAS